MYLQKQGKDKNQPKGLTTSQKTCQLYLTLFKTKYVCQLALKIQFKKFYIF
jgi:hypothetical protein